MKVVLCGHTGSMNRGCEAIVRSTAGILKEHGIKCVLATFARNEDSDAGLCEFIDTVAYRKIRAASPPYFMLGFLSRVCGIKKPLHRFIQGNIWEMLNGNIALNIGGDTYCYEKPVAAYYLNRYTHKKNIKSILWGCSIEKDRIDEEMIRDFRRYALIMPRETLSYNTLVDRGINKKNLRLMVDPAFTLETQPVPLPELFEENKVIGMNLSPIVMKCGKDGRIALENFLNLIEYIIDITNLKIALIPHVYGENSEDMLPLKEIYEKCKSTDRVILLSKNYNCMQLKYLISKCRFMVACRTHASIAAYSMSVPTLVVGYSIKARGIAKDIFGSYENYVLPVQSLRAPDQLKDAFIWLMKNESRIKDHLFSCMPKYVRMAWRAGAEVKGLIEKIA